MNVVTCEFRDLQPGVREPIPLAVEHCYWRCLGCNWEVPLNTIEQSELKTGS